MQRILILMLFIPLRFFAQNVDWKTDFERSDEKATPRYASTTEFCRRLDEASGEAFFTSFGKSARGRDLPLMIVDRDGLTDPQKIRDAGRIIVMIQACIHPGESEGKDAGLMLLRDMLIRKQQIGLLEHVSLLFIPIFNVDGHERFGPYNRINQNGPEEMGWRVTASNLNLNRDYLKADTPEMQAWLLLFNHWLPEFFIDTHTTDGADYQYVLTYQMNSLGDMETGLTTWTNTFFLPGFTKSLDNKGIPVFPYVEFRNWHDPKSGLRTGVAPPMLSQGYTSQRNRPGLLLETHMLKPYGQRVHATYQCLFTSLKILNTEFRELRQLVEKADRYTAGQEFREIPFPVQYETSSTDSIMVDFLGIHYETRKSDLTGRTWFDYGTGKETFRIPFFNTVKPVITIKLPEAYLVPPEWNVIIERMEVHGIRIQRLQRDTVLHVSCYRFLQPKWRQGPYEGRHPLSGIEYTEETAEQLFPAGSALIRMDQPAARIIAYMLEPKGSGSFLSWGFFDAIFEQKEYAEQYVLEKMAESMLKKDPALRKEFEAKKVSDPGFAQDSDAILNWFYTKTPYWDQEKNHYPVGRIFDAAAVDGLPVTGP